MNRKYHELLQPEAGKEKQNLLQKKKGKEEQKERSPPPPRNLTESVKIYALPTTT